MDQLTEHEAPRGGLLAGRCTVEADGRVGTWLGRGGHVRVARCGPGERGEREEGVALRGKRPRRCVHEETGAKAAAGKGVADPSLERDGVATEAGRFGLGWSGGNWRSSIPK